MLNVHTTFADTGFSYMEKTEQTSNATAGGTSHWTHYLHHTILRATTTNTGFTGSNTTFENLTFSSYENSNGTTTSTGNNLASTSTYQSTKYDSTSQGGGSFTRFLTSTDTTSLNQTFTTTRSTTSDPTWRTSTTKSAGTRTTTTDTSLTTSSTAAATGTYTVFLSNGFGIPTAITQRLSRVIRGDHESLLPLSLDHTYSESGLMADFMSLATSQYDDLHQSLALAGATNTTATSFGYSVSSVVGTITNTRTSTTRSSTRTASSQAFVFSFVGNSLGTRTHTTQSWLTTLTTTEGSTGMSTSSGIMTSVRDELLEAFKEHTVAGETYTYEDTSYSTHSTKLIYISAPEFTSASISVIAWDTATFANTTRRWRFLSTSSTGSTSYTLNGRLRSAEDYSQASTVAEGLSTNNFGSWLANVGDVMLPPAIGSTDAQYAQILQDGSGLSYPLGAVSASAFWGAPVIPLYSADTEFSHTVSYDTAANIWYQTKEGTSSTYTLAGSYSFKGNDFDGAQPYITNLPTKRFGIGGSYIETEDAYLVLTPRSHSVYRYTITNSSGSFTGLHAATKHSTLHISRSEFLVAERVATWRRSAGGVLAVSSYQPYDESQQ